ncbi:type I-F CRISPR-associated protein Csy2 [Abyssibacter profundi]|uniref:Type I-F CRISPR-associated protein Csy2 n=2 Tax=Abyssibacter profundi TaxID=2182787 RepID=A0A363UP55_9GAMM|nr:type I-F CRISPR-associated protein Csy2 [Abyssibacter profundi]
MSACPSFDYLMVLPHLRVQNANAVSSPLTHGFPSMTAFLGLMWALERRCRAAGLDLTFRAVGVVCHDHQEQVSDDWFVKSFRLTRNPIDKHGKTAAIVEEGRIHLELSLVFAVESERWLRDPDARQADTGTVAELVSQMRVAGGTIMPPENPTWHRYQPYSEPMHGEKRWESFRKLRMRWLPGFTLVSRDELIDTRLAELHEDDAEATRLDAWLSLCRINWRYETPEKDTAQARRDAWKHDRDGLGWIVPIPVGYGALGDVYPAGAVANARDASTPFRFVESLYSVGQWISPHRLHDPQQMLWYADSQPDNGLYRCRNDFLPTPEFDLFEASFD